MHDAYVSDFFISAALERLLTLYERYFSSYKDPLFWSKPLPKFQLRPKMSFKGIKMASLQFTGSVQISSEASH